MPVVGRLRLAADRRDALIDEAAMPVSTIRMSLAFCWGNVKQRSLHRWWWVGGALGVGWIVEFCHVDSAGAVFVAAPYPSARRAFAGQTLHT